MFFDEIHIKPFIRYREDHIIRNNVDQPETEAKTFLALRVCCLMGGSTFVARLIPVHSLEHEFLSEQLKQLLHIVHDCGGFVDFLSDNCRCILRCLPIWSQIYLIFFENSSFYWSTDPVEARSTDLIEICKEELVTTIKKAKLYYSSFYPRNFEKQKDYLALDIFNAKKFSGTTTPWDDRHSCLLRRLQSFGTFFSLKVRTKTNVCITLDGSNSKPLMTQDWNTYEKWSNTSNTTYKHRIKSLTSD